MVIKEEGEAGKKVLREWEGSVVAIQANYPNRRKIADSWMSREWTESQFRSNYLLSSNQPFDH
jgi:hypothetical protein